MGLVSTEKCPLGIQLWRPQLTEEKNKTKQNIKLLRSHYGISHDLKWQWKELQLTRVLSNQKEELCSRSSLGRGRRAEGEGQKAEENDKRQRESRGQRAEGSLD